MMLPRLPSLLNTPPKLEKVKRRCTINKRKRERQRKKRRQKQRQPLMLQMLILMIMITTRRTSFKSNRIPTCLT